jgi:hypothetical protein
MLNKTAEDTKFGGYGGSEKKVSKEGVKPVRRG